MKKFKLITYFLILVSTTCFADPVVVSLDKGQVAPFDGYLFTPEKEKELRLLDSNVNYYKSLSDSLNTINKVQGDSLDKMQERITLRDTQIDNLTKRVNDSDTGFFTKAGYFIFGAVVTGLIAQSIYRTK